MMMDMFFKLYNHVRAAVLLGGGGAGTQQGFVKHMRKFHADGKSLH